MGGDWWYSINSELHIYLSRNSSTGANRVAVLLSATVAVVWAFNKIKFGVLKIFHYVKNKCSLSQRLPSGWTMRKQNNTYYAIMCKYLSFFLDM